MYEFVTLRSAGEVRTEVARYLSDAAEVGAMYLAGDLHHVMFNTIEPVIEAAATGEGDTFPAELAELISQHEEGVFGHDRLAFLVAMALYTR